ncbi:bifunctional diguanylate cyclase/phosphodiesterase [Mycolicibacterium arenosum]|uniref:EAL domain-containing protein n=1 Tax=Mycolicibacterium arenosum TaxID=2952157 RepID=A0ABT1LXK4_9MYCO|nr:EAL domain-containing protein [Mycolicibacterium sp. CAU 1645]MCP9270794.1 EAL domain-containing protein [Mycolicibacterium sp. CAU 1645]
MDRVLRPALLFVAFPLLYALSIVAGRASRLGGGEVALVWPAAAVAIIWILEAQRRGPRECVVHLVLLGVLTFAVNIATGASVSLAAWFVLVNVALAVVTVGILTHRRDRAVLRDPADMARLIAAIAAGTCCAALLATVFLVLTADQPVWKTFGLFAVRNGASALLAVSIWLRLQDVAWRRPRMSAARAVEALLAGGAVAAIFVGVFWLNNGAPMAFLALVPAMGLALRYSTTANSVFLLAAGTWIIFAALANRGAFIVLDIEARALLAQSLVCSLTVVVLTLSLYRDSRVRLISELEQARDQADRSSELMGAVLDSIHDSVVVVDPAGAVVVQNARAANSGLVDDVVAIAPGSSRPVPHDVVITADDARVIELTTAPLAPASFFKVMAFRDVTEQRTNARSLREARDLFSGVLQAVSEQAIIGTDPSGRITVFNNGAERLLGWSSEEMLGRTPLDFHLDTEVCARAADMGIPAGFEVFVHNVTADVAEVREWTYVRRDGAHVAVSLAVSRMTAEDGSCAGYIGVATDITEQKAAKHALAESEERFRLAFDTAPMGMFMFEVTAPRTGCVTRCNQAMADILGGSTAQVLEMTASGLGLERLLSLGVGEAFDAEMSFRRADGGTVWGAVSSSVVAPRGRDPYGICLVADITGRKLVEDELHRMALHDPLTGLANRALLVDRIEHALAGAGHENPAGVGLIFLDLDGFKTVNDTWGHAQGDEVLKVVAQRIMGSIRSGDTAARLGGDEFAVLCPDVAGVVQLERVAKRILAELRRPVGLADGGTYDQLSGSVGVVTANRASTAGSLLQRADTLMYQAKRNGKDCITIDESPAEADSFCAVGLIPELARAVERAEFIVHVQPIVDLRTGDCVAVEALVRWRHPERGVLTPDDFLAVAESSHYMSAIGRQVLNEACRQTRQWTGLMADAAVHVNVSGRQLELGDFRADVLNALARTGLRPDRLVLELTETHAGRVAESAKADLERLRQIGVRVAIDDVGTGFSGLAKIVDLPVDILKIDKQFVHGLGRDPRCEAITKAVLSLGSSLDMTVIAEGIESRSQCELLTEWGCALGQGYLFGHPVAATEAMTANGCAHHP